MTIGALVKDLKYRVGPGIEVPDDGLAQWINNNYMYMVDEITKVAPDYFTTSATTNKVSGQTEYDLPDDYEKISIINVLIRGTWVRALPLPVGQGDLPVVNAPNNNLSLSQATPFYYVSNGQLGLTPTPDESVTNGIEIWYVFTPTEMGTGDSPDEPIPAKYHSILSLGAYADYLDQNDEHGAAENMRNRFEERVAKMIETIDDSDIDQPKSVVVTSNADLYTNNDHI